MAFNTHTTVKLLVKNQVLIDKWQEFVGELNLQAEMFHWRNAFNNRTITTHELFTNILIEWKSKRGKDRTLQKLASAVNNVDTPYKYEVSENSLVSLGASNHGLVPYGLTTSVSNFTGRDDELSELQATFNSKLKYALVCGLGGIGKTELVKKFAHKNSKRNYVTWLNGDTPSTLISSITDLATHLGIRISIDHCKDELKILQKIANRLSNRKWLMIIDNVDEIHEKYQSVLQFTNNIHNIFVVVTSQSSSVLDGRAELIEIENLLPTEAFQLVKKSIVTESSSEQIEKLCYTLQYFTLALHQAIAYIIQQQQFHTQGNTFGIQEYLKEFEIQGKHLLDDVPVVIKENEKTLLITWNVTLEQIRTRDKLLYSQLVNILNILAFLDPEKLHTDFLYEIYLFPSTSTVDDKEQTTKNSFTLALETLKNYSIIEIENNSVSVHRLVQEIIRVSLNQKTTTETLDTIITNIEIEKFQKTEMLHVLSVWRQIQKQTDLFIKHKDVAVSIFNKLQDMLLYFESLKFAENNFKIFKEILGEENVYALVMEGCFAFATADIGDCEKALELFETILPKQQRIFGKDHSQSLATADHMGATFLKLKRYSEALKIYYENLEIIKKKFGKDHKDAIDILHNIASVFYDQQNFPEAIKLYQKVLKWKINNLGPHHRFTLIARQFLASCLFHQNKYKKAVIEFENITELMLKYLGEEDADTLRTKYLLANTLKSIGQEGRAWQILNEILPLQIFNLGEDHSHTIHTKCIIEVLAS